MSRAFNLQSLRFQLPLLLLVYCVVVGFAIFVVVDRTQERRFEEEFEARQLARATELQDRTERAAERNELETGQREFGELAATEAVRAAVFLAPDQRVLLTSRREWLNEPVNLGAFGLSGEDQERVEEAMRASRAEQGARRVYTADRTHLVLVLPAALPLVPGALSVDRRGVIVLVYDMRMSKAVNTHRLRLLFLLIAGAIVLAMLVLGLALHFFVTRRLERIQALIARFAAGGSIDESPSRRADEISAIGDRFKAMAHTIRYEMAERLEATAALRASEDKFRTAMQYSPIGQALMGRDGRWAEVNPALCQIVGYSAAELQAMTFRDITHPDDQAESDQLNRSVVSGEVDTFEVEKRYLHKDGHVVWVQLNASTMRRDDGSVLFVSQIQDITERKHAAARLVSANRALRAISHCNQALVHATDEPSLLKEICRVIVEDGGYRLAWVAFARSQGLVAAAQWGDDDGYIGDTLDIWETERRQPGALQDFLAGGETRVIRDYATDSFAEPWREQALRRGLRSSALFALREEGRTFGALIIYSDQPNAFDEHEMTLLSEMAQDLAYGIQALRTRTRQQRAEAELRDSQSKLVIAMDVARLAPWEFDVLTGRFNFNDAFYALLRTTAEAEGGFTMSAETYAEKFLPIEEAGLVGEEIARSTATTDPNFTSRLEHRLLRADGTVGHVSVSYAIEKDAAGRTVRTYGVNQDITERKEAEDAVVASNERYARHEAALATLTRYQVQTPDQFIDVVRSMNEVVASTLEVGRVSVWRVTGPASFECTDAFESPANRHQSGMTSEGEGVLGYMRLLEEADVLAMSDTEGDQREFVVKYLVPAGVRSLLAVPIRSQGGLMAALGCSTQTTRRWMPDEQTFLVAVANLLASWFAQVERLHLEAQLRQATKLEGIGQLAGGVAHDFNNVLTVILGKAGQLADDSRMPEDLREAADDITQSGERAANLTRQLLAFSRRQAMQVRDLDLNVVIQSVARMLDRILGEDLTLDVVIAPQPAYVRADAGMLDQVVLNLAVNARDAMRDGGRLTVETSVVSLDPHAAQHVSRPAGPYVCLRVTDTGSGIPAKHLPHIFEPFFTTKDVGKGTGLGLATTYGIIQQHNGWIEVESELGRGTTFSIYLPSFTQPDLAAPAEEAAPRAVAVSEPGRETILVVEDEAEVRALIVDALGGLGYHVIEAPSGPAALGVWREHAASVQLLITDMVMPGGMNGLDLASRLRDDEPGLRVIFMSGYLADVSRDALSQSEGTSYLAKPFNLPTLARLVRQSLDAVPEAKS